MPSEKYKTLPNPDEASYAVVSMGSIQDHIREYLDCFPVWNKDQPPCAMSTTVLWSGSQGNNVSVRLYCNALMGVVLDPARVSMPQADLRAAGSLGKIAAEMKKSEGTHLTKYPEKTGYYRKNIFITNLAKNKHKEDGTSVYLTEGSVAVFAENIWRKFFHLNAENTAPKYPTLFLNRENTLMKLNEGLAFEIAGAGNPIIGIILRAPSNNDELNKLADLSTLLIEKPHLGLYLYDPTANEHILRYLPHDVAIAYLLEAPNEFESFFDCAIPYVIKHPNNIIQDTLSIKMNYLFFKESLSPCVLARINYLIRKKIIPLDQAERLTTLLSHYIFYYLFKKGILSAERALTVTQEEQHHLLTQPKKRLVVVIETLAPSFDRLLNFCEKKYEGPKATSIQKTNEQCCCRIM